MSGFERSMPIPGSQGPRRSQMQRPNNHAPPMTPWRKEVLEAQRQLAELKRGKSRSRSRSRQRSSAGCVADSTSGGASSSGSRTGKAEGDSASKNNTQALLRNAKQVGEGWYAALAKSAQLWEEEEQRRKKMNLAKPPIVERGKEKQSKEVERERDKRRAREEKAPRHEDDDRGSDARKREQERVVQENREKEEQERRWKAESALREQRLAEEKRKAEEERQKKQLMEKQRKSKLSGAFAVDSGDEDEGDRDTKLLHQRGAPKGKTPLFAERGPAPIVAAQATAGLGQQLALPSSAAPLPVADLGRKLGFDDVADPAAAFMRLQERKRKGRRAEFGGPPRGCSPWRDGKKGLKPGDGRVV